MYNELEYDLTVLDLPNIVYAHRKGQTVPIVAHPFLRPLLMKLAKARPKWTLVGTRFVTREDEPNRAVSFTVFEGNDELGTIAKSYNYGTSTDVFAIDNKRMSDKRQRGCATTTKDVNKAFKIITREFHAKTVDELVREAAGTVLSAVNLVSSSARNAYNHRVNALSAVMLGFAVAKWEEFASIARKTGVPESSLDTFHDVKQLHEDALAMEYARMAKTGMLVVLRGNDYIVQRGDETTILSHEQLTPHMKRCIGMLKLADKGTFIPGMGVKGGPDNMFVMPEPQEAGIDD